MAILIDVVFLPSQLQSGQLRGHAVGVFDVLRATTTMTAALAVGVETIHLFQNVEAVRAAAAESELSPLLCGEMQCLTPPGFHLGNSPGVLGPQQAGRTIFMSTTNGTRAILAANEAAVRFAAALVNATAVANALVATGLPITLLCSGTSGKMSLEDVLGCGAVIESVRKLQPTVDLASDSALLASELFLSHRSGLRSLMARGEGGRNIIAAGLDPDIDFAAQVDSTDVVGVIVGVDAIVRKNAVTALRH